ncbi:universal stress protein [Halococcus thailandensis]|uniref:universal stress protein n=1 Tax=Halococcus thailandensis TaxID=335952 RepID=UPI001F4CCCBB|nr:universal stress protein [Halococcus thailandensis]
MCRHSDDVDVAQLGIIEDCAVWLPLEDLRHSRDATLVGALGGVADDLLIPTDGSEPAAAAVSHGIAIAEAIGARIHAVNIIDADALAPTPEHTAPKKLLDRFEAEGERTTGEIATRATNAGVDVTTSVREGYPTRDLLAYADAHNIDLIAMGTTGQTNLNRYLLGSTAERVIRHAEVPVLAVNAKGSMKR